MAGNWEKSFSGWVRPLVGPDLGPRLEAPWGNVARTGVTKVTPYMIGAKAWTR